MSTNKTSNFGLNQWEPGDQVLREEFNADNQKIDTALGAVPYKKLLEVVTTTAANSVDLDVSGIRFTDYMMVDLFCSSANTERPISVQVNHQTSDYSYGSAGATGGNSGKNTVLAYMGGRLLFHTPCQGVPVGCLYFYGTTGFSGYQSTAHCKWEELESIQFSRATGIPAGTKFALYGIEK